MKKNFARLSIVLMWLVVLLIGMPVNAQTSGYKLTVLHTNDMHGHWEPVVVSSVSSGGIARRATLVQKLRQENPNTLLVDAGDISQGTLYFTQYKNQEGRDFYNLLGYDVVTLGNHEFDLGPKVLAENFIAGAKFAIVNANVDFTNEPALAGKLPAYVIKEIGGQKIGVFGMITDELPTDSNAGTNIKMKNAVTTAQAIVADFEKQGVNKVIMLSHRGYVPDVDLANQVNGIDLIVGGHSHTLLGDANQLDKSLGAPVAPYPVIVKTPNGGKTLIVQDFEFGRSLGKIDLSFDDQGQVTSYQGQPIFVDKNIADDPKIAQQVIDRAKPLEDLKKQLIGQTSVILDGDTRLVRSQETNLGDLVADAMLWATAWDKTQIAVINGGSVRRTVAVGNISYGDVLEVLPFGNRLVEMSVSGADIVAALENGISQVYSDGGSGGRFPQIAGMKFSADFSKPIGARVTAVQIGNSQAGYKPIDPAATYRLVTNDFMATGGDGYVTFKNGKNVDGGDVPLDQALIDYIKFLNAPISLRAEGRINLIGTPPFAPTSVPSPTATRNVTVTVTPTNIPATTTAIPPTPTQVPPTATVIPATATLVPATATPIPPTVIPATATPMPSPTPTSAPSNDYTMLIVIVGGVIVIGYVGYRIVRSWQA